MKMFTPAVILTIMVLFSSCAIFVYDDDHPRDDDDSGDTLTIIITEPLSPLGP